MKFDVILAQYLNQHKKLNLPGIGTFETDNSSLSWDENGKQKAAGSGITFKNAPVAKADDDLITYITEQTGKMKPLAISDLESFLTLGKQFLYIGKPFYLEGIGTLQFAKGGSFDFVPGEYITTKLEDPSQERAEERKRLAESEERQPANPSRATNRNGGRGVLTWLIILLSLGLVGWAAYYFYTVHNAGQPVVPKDTTAVTPRNTFTDPVPAENGAALVNAPDTMVKKPVQQSYYDKDNFRKFIVERTTDKQRALNRYRKLKSFGNDIEMETSDSITFSIFFIMPATAADTARIRDSLDRWYYGNSKSNRVIVE